MVCMSLEQSSSVGPLDYKELFIRIYSFLCYSFQ